MPKFNNAIGLVALAAAGFVSGTNDEGEMAPFIARHKIARLRRLRNASPPAGANLIILAVATEKDFFTSGEVLRETSIALGEAMSPTTLHRTLPALAQLGLIREVGPVNDVVSKRAVTGFAITEAGEEYLRCADRMAEIIEALAA